MKHAERLSEEDLSFIYDNFPLEGAYKEFKKNIKGFHKVFPGLRPDSEVLNKNRQLLFSKKDEPFISNVFEKLIGSCLEKIKIEREKLIQEGLDEEISLSHALVISDLADKTDIYFKLTEAKYSDDFKKLIQGTVKELQKNNEIVACKDTEIRAKDEKLTSAQRALEKKNIAYEKIKKQLDNQKNDNKKQLQNINKVINENKDNLRVMAVDYNNLSVKVQNLHHINKVLEKKIRKIELLNQTEEDLSDNIEKIDKLKLTTENLLNQIERLERKQKDATIIIKNNKVVRPKDMDGFHKNLYDNLKVLGIQDDDDIKYMFLLREHLPQILFTGVPIIVNRTSGNILLRCVSNSLLGKIDVNVLPFTNALSVDDIDEYLLYSGRVVCLDNFLGNFNEITLIPLFERHKGHIIFLTYSYDRTLNYVSEEFLRYTNYLNISRIRHINFESGITIQSPPVEECEFQVSLPDKDPFYSDYLKEILTDFGYPKILIEHKCSLVTNETDLLRILAFDVLPYCSDVLQISPFNASDRFLKFIKVNSNSPSKILLKKWFA
jgi:hypothetical protein